MISLDRVNFNIFGTATPTIVSGCAAQQRLGFGPDKIDATGITRWLIVAAGSECDPENVSALRWDPSFIPDITVFPGGSAPADRLPVKALAKQV